MIPFEIIFVASLWVLLAILWNVSSNLPKDILRKDFELAACGIFMCFFIVGCILLILDCYLDYKNFYVKLF